MGKKLLFSVILSLLLLSVLSVFSLAESDVSVTAVNNLITPGEKAEFLVKITNNENVAQTYDIFSISYSWEAETDPLSDKEITLAPKQSYEAKVLAYTLFDLDANVYTINLNVESRIGEKYSLPVKIYLKSKSTPNYLPSFKATLDMNEKIDPREPVSIKLFLENRNALDMKDMKLNIRSDIPEFAQEFPVSLAPLEKKTFEFTIVPNRYQEPKDYLLFFAFENAGETIKLLEKNIQVIPVLPDFVSEVDIEKYYFNVITTLKVTNPGNVPNTQQVKYPVGFWQYLFTPAENKIKDASGQRYIVLEQKLLPDEETTFVLITHYRVLAYLLLIILLFLGFYFYVDSPAILTKMAITTKNAGEGSYSEIKVTLELKNKGQKPLKDISITDFVPEIANVEKSLELGTLRPEEVKHTKQGTKLVWKISELDFGEQRVISYKIKAKLSILGTFSLPRAETSFSHASGRKSKAYSNVFRLSA